MPTPAPVLRPDSHPAARVGRVGVLLVNLGSPDAPDVPSVKRFLGEFLSDPRVIEIPAFLWKPILNLLILNIRPRTTAANYAKVWTPDGSPITAITKAQAAALEGRFGPNVIVDWAMRYGTRSIGERLEALQQQGCDRILLAPLYPQYSSTTSGSSIQEWMEAIGRWPLPSASG
jgi:ferrochelatase